MSSYTVDVENIYIFAERIVFLIHSIISTYKLQEYTLAVSLFTYVVRSIVHIYHLFSSTFIIYFLLLIFSLFIDISWKVR